MPLLDAGERKRLLVDWAQDPPVPYPSDCRIHELFAAQAARTPDAEALLPKFARDGVVELDGASVRRVGKAAVVTQNNPRFLNAEDQTSLAGAEICVDLALLDPKTELWTPLPSAPTGRAWGSIVTVRGVVYQLSGTGDGETAYRTIERLAFN